MQEVVTVFLFISFKIFLLDFINQQCFQWQKINQLWKDHFFRDKYSLCTLFQSNCTECNEDFKSFPVTLHFFPHLKCQFPIMTFNTNVKCKTLIALFFFKFKKFFIRLNKNKFSVPVRIFTDTHAVYAQECYVNLNFIIKKYNILN